MIYNIMEKPRFTYNAPFVPYDDPIAPLEPKAAFNRRGPEKDKGMGKEALGYIRERLNRAQENVKS